jgi:hypothetical protein
MASKRNRLNSYQINGLLRNVELPSTFARARSGRLFFPQLRRQILGQETRRMTCLKNSLIPICIPEGCRGMQS